MKYCPSCGTTLDDAAAFCTACGAQQIPVAPAAPVEAAPEEAPAYAAPVYEPAPEVVPTTAYVGEPQAPAYAPAPNYAPQYAPVYPANYAPAPTTSVGAKVSAGVGFGLVMFGFLFAIIVFCMGLVAGADCDEELATGVVTFFFMFFPPSLIGLILCGNGRKNGAGGLAVTGKVFGIISVVMYGLGLLVSLIAFA